MENNEQVDIPLPQEEVKRADLPDKICTSCLELNLIQAGVIDKWVRCKTCNDYFCIHGASKLDPQNCIHCCNDFKIIDVVETEAREIRNSEGLLIGTRNHRVRHITLSGLDWLFYNRRINDLTDVELEHAIEYHQSIFNGMMYEREARRIKHFQRNKGKVAGNEQISLLSSTQDGVVITLDTASESYTKKTASSVTKVRRTRTVKTASSAQKSEQALNEILKGLVKQGLSKDQIMSLLKK